MWVSSHAITTNSAMTTVNVNASLSMFPPSQLSRATLPPWL
jgi:hypothetical protein